MTKCVGCGIKLQEKDKNELGYTPNLNNELCERCFKLKNYNILTNKGINIDNDKLINKINELNTCVLFLVDFINLDSEVIDAYKKIKSKKILIITKADIIPKNIKYQKLIQNIKNIYEIKEDLILTSSKTKLNIKTITKICLEEKNICLAGFTNAGKSSLINALFMGYYLSLAKISNLKEKKELEKENIFKSLIIPTILHGIYDFCLLSGNIPLILLAIVFIIFLYIVSINKLNYVVKNNIKLIKEKNINFNDHQNTGNAN